MRRRYLVPMGAIGTLYAINRFLLSPLTGSRLLSVLSPWAAVSFGRW